MAELVQNDPTRVPDLFYLRAYYAHEKLTTSQAEAMRARVLELCGQTKDIHFASSMGASAVAQPQSGSCAPAALGDASRWPERLGFDSPLAIQAPTRLEIARDQLAKERLIHEVRATPQEVEKLRLKWWEMRRFEAEIYAGDPDDDHGIIWETPLLLGAWFAWVWRGSQSGPWYKRVGCAAILLVLMAATYLVVMGTFDRIPHHDAMGY